jgi:uncharacterized DUF497 family protein
LADSFERLPGAAILRRVQFEWDPAKDAENRRKHDVGFDEASTVFGDPFAITIGDPDHSFDEYRYQTAGYSRQNRLIIVAHTYRAGRIRIISARPVSATERRTYEGEHESR